MMNKIEMSPITMALKEAIERLRLQNGHELSAHAFNSLYLWADKLGLSINLGEEGFLVKMACEGENTYFYPCGTKNAQLEYIKMLQEENLKLLYLRNEDRQFLEEHFPGQFTFSRDEAADEYIFSKEEQEKLEGKKFAKLRNQLNRLQKEHLIENVPLTAENISEAARVMEGIQPIERMLGAHALIDDGVAQKVIACHRDLEMQGVLVMVDGRAEAFTLGFKLTEDTIDGCIERHNKDIPGLSVYTQRILLMESTPEIRYMNAEEDLGLSGIRLMKQHMGPFKMNEIWTASLK